MTKYINHTLFTIFTILLTGNLVCAQNIDNISSSLQKEVITKLSQLIKKEYVLEDIGLKISSHLDSLNSDTILEAEMDSGEFIQFLNKELQSIYIDKHLSIVNQEKFKQLQKMFGAEDGSQHQNPAKEQDKPNNHFNQNKESHNNGHDSHSGKPNKEKSELDGSRIINRDGRTNIGFLKLSLFNGSENGINRMNTLFTSFVGVDAIIIDLRECKGGDADMVKILSGYFFETSKYLTSTIGRKNENGERKTAERWTIMNDLSSEFSNTPLYIMTSSKTFSAAESFVFGLQLNKRATLIGESTGGGGHMNTIFELPGGYGASISVGRTFDGKTGKGFQNVGVQTDIQVEADHTFAKTLELIEQKREIELAYNPTKEEVHQALQRLSEAWYSGDVKSAESLIYYKCKTYASTNDESIVNEVDLLKLIKAGAGSKTPREVRNRDISVYEVRNNETAIARLMFRDQIHYLHLVNDNGSWKIISDLITKKQMHG